VNLQKIVEAFWKVAASSLDIFGFARNVVTSTQKYCDSSFSCACALLQVSHEAKKKKYTTLGVVVCVSS